MAELGRPEKTIEILQKYHVVFQKKFGQNFLIDEHVLGKIIQAAEITKDDVVLEIGPGIGTMTQYLAEAAGQVVAIEIDRNLLQILDETLSGYDNVTVISGDAMKIDLRKTLTDACGGELPASLKVCANLPYYITTPLIMMLLEGDIPFQNLTLMVQKEVAERMQAGPGTKDYGALSLAVQYYADPYIAAYVPQNCFMPRPNVDSAVIRLTKRPEPPVSVQDEALLFKLIRASFSQRRKTLVNGLTNSRELNLSKEQAAAAVVAAGFDPQIRGEKLTLEEFATLANVVAGM